MGCKELDITDYFCFTGSPKNPPMRFFPVVSVSISAYRYYSPSLGRWINRDPIGEIGGFNIYGFVANNPIWRTDFFGLAWFKVTLSTSKNVGKAKFIEWVDTGVKGHYLKKRSQKYNEKTKCCDTTYTYIPWKKVKGKYEQKISTLRITIFLYIPNAMLASKPNDENIIEFATTHAVGAVPFGGYVVEASERLSDSYQAAKRPNTISFYPGKWDTKDGSYFLYSYWAYIHNDDKTVEQTFSIESSKEACPTITEENETPPPWEQGPEKDDKLPKPLKGDSNEKK